MEPRSFDQIRSSVSVYNPLRRPTCKRNVSQPPRRGCSRAAFREALLKVAAAASTAIDSVQCSYLSGKPLWRTRGERSNFVRSALDDAFLFARSRLRSHGGKIAPAVFLNAHGRFAEGRRRGLPAVVARMVLLVNCPVDNGLLAVLAKEISRCRASRHLFQ